MKLLYEICRKWMKIVSLLWMFASFAQKWVGVILGFIQLRLSCLVFWELEMTNYGMQLRCWSFWILGRIPCPTLMTQLDPQMDSRWRSNAGVLTVGPSLRNMKNIEVPMCIEFIFLDLSPDQMHSHIPLVPFVIAMEDKHLQQLNRLYMIRNGDAHGFSVANCWMTWGSHGYPTLNPLIPTGNGLES